MGFSGYTNALKEREYDGPLWEQVGFSKIRNRSLANAFAYMDLVEAWGSGIPKLMQAMQEYGLREPEFVDMEVAFRINLYRCQIGINELKNDTNDTKKDTNPDIDLEKQLLQIICQNPEVTQKTMAEQLSLSLITVKRTFITFQKDGKVKREGSNRKGKWILLFADHSFKNSIISCCAVRQKRQEKSQGILAFGFPE